MTNEKRRWRALYRNANNEAIDYHSCHELLCVCMFAVFVVYKFFCDVRKCDSTDSIYKIQKKKPHICNRIQSTKHNMTENEIKTDNKPKCYCSCKRNPNVCMFQWSKFIANRTEFIARWNAHSCRSFSVRSAFHWECEQTVVYIYMFFFMMALVIANPAWDLHIQFHKPSDRS